MAGTILNGGTQEARRWQRDLVGVQLRGRSGELGGDRRAQIGKQRNADSGHDGQQDRIFSKRRTALIAAERPQARHDFHLRLRVSKCHERFVSDVEDVRRKHFHKCVRRARARQYRNSTSAAQIK